MYCLTLFSHKSFLKFEVIIKKKLPLSSCTMQEQSRSSWRGTLAAAILPMFAGNIWLQGCEIPMSHLFDSGLLVGEQVDFTRGLVRRQVNLREI